MIDAEGGVSEVIQCDVTKEESCKAAVEKTVELFGAVHILVNIVGVGGPHGNVVDVDLEAWDRDFRINVSLLRVHSESCLNDGALIGHQHGTHVPIRRTRDAQARKRLYRQYV